MSIQSAMLTAMLAALSAMSVNALPQGATTPPNAVAMLYTGGGCTGKSTTFAISGNNVCVELPAPATSAKIVSYAAAGCQADFFPEANCNGGPTGGTYGAINNCEQNGMPFLSVFIRCS